MENKNCNIIHLSETGSTNDYLKELLKHDQPAEGTMVLADHQTAGKGLDTNTWESESGKNLLMSLVFYPDFVPADRQFVISMAVALGICDYLEDQLPDDDILIKWPNDIYAGREKIAGILITNEILGLKIEHVIVGIGLNMNQENFSENIPNPISLAMLTGNYFDLEAEARRLRDCVAVRYEQLREGLYDRIRADYLDRLLGLNESRKYLYKGNKIEGVITGVDEYGRLQLETGGGEIVCDLKDITYIF